MNADIDRLSHLRQAKEALDAGDLEGVREQLDRAERQARTLKDYSISWIADSLSFIAEELGEEAVERALRRFGERHLAPTDDDNDLWAVPAEVRAKVVTRAMLANFGAVDVDEDDDKITLSFRCGSGGWLIDQGAYDGSDALVTLRERGPRTFDRDELPVYCAHCSVNNEMQAVEWRGTLTTVEHPPTAPGEPCVHEVYKRPDAVPAEAYSRIGLSRPATRDPSDRS
ncbi:MAG: hypothetical protein OES57_09960 [Acidimicrobiia bacterium]|nr:hypothetical protein [Acidimicrobiia bacterium]